MMAAHFSDTMVHLKFSFTHVCIGVHMFVHAHVCRPEVKTEKLPPLSSILVFEVESFIEPGFLSLAR